MGLDKHYVSAWLSKMEHGATLRLWDIVPSHGRCEQSVAGIVPAPSVYKEFAFDNAQ